MVHAQSQFQNLLHKVEDVKTSKYPNCIVHIVVRFGVESQSLTVE